MPKPDWAWTITFGQVLQIAAFACTVLVFALQYEQRLTKSESGLEGLGTRLDDLRLELKRDVLDLEGVVADLAEAIRREGAADIEVRARIWEILRAHADRIANTSERIAALSAVLERVERVLTRVEEQALERVRREDRQ